MRSASLSALRVVAVLGAPPLACAVALAAPADTRDEAPPPMRQESFVPAAGGLGPMRPAEKSDPAALNEERGGILLRATGLLQGLPTQAAPPPPLPSASSLTKAEKTPLGAAFLGSLRFSHQGSLGLRFEDDRTSLSGPLARANELQPGIVPVTWRDLTLSAEGRGELRSGGASLVGRWSLSGRHVRDAYNPVSDTSWRGQFKELYARADGTAWSLDAGRKVLGWDVGQGFRPNDLVQMEDRRALLPLSLTGVPLVQVEHFTAESAASLVFVNPAHVRRPLETAPGRDETALAARYYRRLGDADLYGFARWGRNTHASVGTAATWVTGNETEIHGSLRGIQRKTSWALNAGDADLPATVPWRLEQGGGAGQALLGGSWTGESKHSLMLEWWYDGTAPSDADWDRWGARNAQLYALRTQAPTQAVAGNLAWQALPLGGQDGNPSLRRQNLLLRWAWQHEAWSPSFDVLVTPKDGGAAWTPAIKWQGNQWNWSLAWRHLDGPSDAVFMSLPARDTAAFSLQWAY